MLTISGFKGKIVRMAFSPTEHVLAVVSARRRKAYLVDLTLGRISRVIGNARSQLADIAFSADGRFLAWVSQDGKLQWLDAESGLLDSRSIPNDFLTRTMETRIAFTDRVPNQFQHLLPEGTDDACLLCLRTIRSLHNASGSLFAHQLKLFQLPAGSNKVIYSGSHAGGDHLQAHGEAGLLMYGTDMTSLRVLSLETTEELCRIQMQQPIIAAGLAGASDLVVTASESGILVSDLHGNVATQRDCDQQPTVTGMSVSPDGEQIATCSVDGSVSIWNVDRNTEPSELLKRCSRWDWQLGALEQVEYSPDGRLIAAGGDGFVTLQDVDS